MWSIGLAQMKQTSRSSAVSSPTSVFEERAFKSPWMFEAASVRRVPKLPPGGLAWLESGAVPEWKGPAPAAPSLPCSCPLPLPLPPLFALGPLPRPLPRPRGEEGASDVLVVMESACDSAGGALTVVGMVSGMMEYVSELSRVAECIAQSPSESLCSYAQCCGLSVFEERQGRGSVTDETESNGEVGLVGS